MKQFEYSITLNNIDLLQRTQSGFVVRWMDTASPAITATPCFLAPLVCEKIRDPNGGGLYARVLDKRVPLGRIEWTVLNALNQAGSISIEEIETLIGDRGGKSYEMTGDSARSACRRINSALGELGILAVVERRPDGFEII